MGDNSVELAILADSFKSLTDINVRISCDKIVKTSLLCLYVKFVDSR